MATDEHSNDADALDAFLGSVQDLMVQLSDASRPYDVAIEVWKLAMSGVATQRTGEIAHPLWLVWGSLTDRVDGPRGDQPGAEEAASELMRRAAREWLSLDGSESERDSYLARWVYDECGYARPT